MDITWTLADFNSSEKPPSWLPADKWESVLAMSVLQGPLDGICVQIATNQSDWNNWYSSECPENESLPFKGSEEISSKNEDVKGKFSIG